MRRAWLALAALAAFLVVAGCGPNPKELEPGMKDFLRELARCVVVNDAASKDRIQALVMAVAGSAGNPVGAKEADTPEGREKLYEANRRWFRKTFRDAGIVEEKDVETFMNAIKFNISDKNAWVTFEIAAEQRRAAETVTLRLARGDKGWRVFEYSREMKGMR